MTDHVSAREQEERLLVLVRSESSDGGSTELPASTSTGARRADEEALALTQAESSRFTPQTRTALSAPRSKYEALSQFLSLTAN